MDEIATLTCPAPTLWWLGGGSFALKYREAVIYLDPGPSAPGAERSPAGLILCSQGDRLDGETIPAMLRAAPRAKLVLPKSAAERAHGLGIPYSRMVTTDAGLRVEYLDDRIYAVPSARGQLDWTPLGGYPYLGYLVRFGEVTIYHAGECVPYESLAARLRPYSVTVALLPIAGLPHSFEIAEAADLAEQIGAKWLVPVSDDAARIEQFIAHLLGSRPAQAFKVFERGERWSVPARSAL